MPDMIREDMNWPPLRNILVNKMEEHSTWYSGDIGLLTRFYSQNRSLSLAPELRVTPTFWGGQYLEGDKALTPVHVPIAGDIAETSSDLLFAEDPIVTLADEDQKSALETLKTYQKMAVGSGLYSKLSEGAESAAAIGGVFVKLAWNGDLSEYPIPVVEQADNAIPEFMFGILRRVHFWSDVTATIEDSYNQSGTETSVVWRLIETYNPDGTIVTKLYKGTGDKLGKEQSEKFELYYGKDIEAEVDSGVDDLLAVYVPNMLPNKLVRSSYQGRSDYMGVEHLMDSLDNTFSNWIKDVYLAQARVFGPEEFFSRKKGDGSTEKRFSANESFYMGLDMDPTQEGNKLTLSQFEIRSEDFERTVLNLIERIVTNAGFSPQSFGLNISGRAESGTALNIRERKSISTKNKKEKYWGPAINKLIKLMNQIYVTQLGGKMDLNVEFNVAFSDSIASDLSETSKSLQMLNAAQAASIETKVKILNPNWSRDQVEAEVQKIQEESGGSTMIDNPDFPQVNTDEEEEEE